MKDTRTDIELLMAWRGGDDRAGTALYDRYSSGVCRFFMNKVRASDAAEDLAQLTWVACVKGRDGLRSDASFRSYLFGVAHNLLREHLRRVVREPVSGSVTSAHDLGPTASALIGSVEQNRVLIEALRAVPLDIQIAYELRYWENLTVPEIAEILDAPEGTIKTRLRRGLELLKQETKRINAAACVLDSTVTTLDRWSAGVRRLLGRA